MILMIYHSNKETRLGIPIIPTVGPVSTMLSKRYLRYQVQKNITYFEVIIVEKILAKIEKNKSEIIRVQLSEFSAHDLIGLRVYINRVDDDPAPT